MSLSEERLAEIRERAAWTCRERGADIDDLLAHVDHLTAKHERARAEWKTTIKFRTTQRNEERAENARLRAENARLRAGIEEMADEAEGAWNTTGWWAARRLRDLLNPTEGDDHE